MLAAWMRLKYPSLITGALAASAPVLQYQDYYDPEQFNRIVTKNYKKYDNCANKIYNAFQIILKNKENLNYLQQRFNLCNKLTSVNELIDYINIAYTYTTMVNYPYENSFLQPLPANPVEKMCKIINKNDEHNLLHVIKDSIGIYYNYTGQQATMF